ncbi:amidohydrolase family protein [Ancylobacter mangrovi]|uniref:Amidohydrolase family protein n=1 Tax=Ancylobacter mangrovi TaxID=2972472 RepID=A0A9X2PD11_9HYPH|nr:amidohydrolase family protein [Ancylobacter mangrovi]MCS0494626.1 amidohydrolase family protein [Ancylobacter mangrovi]MCS0502027.1 amidohydrolase family protein [Ancylobacter mangrovi]
MTLDGPIDCDIHPIVPSSEALLPYLPGHWAEVVVQRGITDLDSASYPQSTPLASRPDWRSDHARPGADLTLLQAHALDRWGLSAAICNCVYGVWPVFSADMAAAFSHGLNAWIAAEWLDRDPRLRSSIIVPLQSPQLAAEEIDRWAGDKRFVQVLLPVFADMPLGNRYYWPIFEAAARHGLPVGIHAGSTYRNPVTPSGWPSYYVEDYVAQSQGFHSQLASLICEGTFVKFPELKVVFIESGFTWMPSALWRLNKYWQGLRMEVPWVDRSPSEIAREHIRLTLQPVDAPPDPELLNRFMTHMESEDMLLFSSDYPHWQFDRDEVVPPGLSPSLLRKIQYDNPRATYSRLTERAQ